MFLVKIFIELRFSFQYLTIRIKCFGFFFAKRQVILKELKQFLFGDLHANRSTMSMTDRCQRSCDEILCMSGMTRRRRCALMKRHRDDIGPWTRRQDPEEIRQGRVKEDRINGSLERKWCGINYCSCKRRVRNSPSVINRAVWQRL